MKIREITFGILILLVWINSRQTFAQDAVASNKKLNEWNIYCDKLKGIPTGKENYPELIKAAIRGINMTASDNFLYKSIFNFHLAGGYESTYKIDSAIHYYEISKKYAEKARNNSRIVLALRRLAGLYDNKQWLKKGDEARSELIEIASVDKDKEIQIGANIVLGEYYLNSGMFEKALPRYIEYIKYLKIDYARDNNSASRSNIGVGYLAVGEIYQNLNRADESLAYFKESIGYLSNYNEGLETAYKDLITSYLSLNKVDSALVYYGVLKKSVEKSGDYTILIDAQVELGKMFTTKEKLDQAGKILFGAEKNATISKEKEDYYLVKNALADLFLKQGDSKRAIKYYKEALPLAIYFKHKAVIATLYLNLATAEKKENLENDAYKHILLYAKYTDSLKTESISKNIIEMEARFQNEVKQQKIGVLNRENETKNLQLKQEKNIRWLLGGTALISLIALSLIYMIYKNKQKANLLLDKKNQQLDITNSQLANANQTKAKLFSIISHDLRSPVSQLFTFLKIQQSAAQLSEEEKNKHQQKLISSSRDLLESMEDLLLWSKSQMENFETDHDIIDIEELFENTVSMLATQIDAKNLKLEMKTGDVDDLDSDENILTIVLRNLLQNAINNAHSGTQLCLFSGINENGQKYLSISNAGNMIPEDKIALLLNSSNVQSKSSGYGLMIVKDLLKKLNADLSISSSNEVTQVRITFN
ncbi:tetratricopeptide repeat-containing sensor histidine kinase [Pedobacter sp. UBA5917]|jgi:signal transduction histidine kinase|uniref:tetratricopeptide repeat-containing sensor histidine kinase n=1 Tax=Pedobacter sp. UBA5917 TaxID=1947061 RepID=UPI0025D46463|nr:ATP-binding protein [Pedobacter sp. UBA5917]